MKWRLSGACFAITCGRSCPTCKRTTSACRPSAAWTRCLPQVRRELEAAVEATGANRGLLVNLAINYGGRAEIVDAVNAVLEMARLDGSIQSLKFDEDLIATNLYTAACPDPDLLIRTSGEMRISNFLLWQIAYAELYVTETLWPDFKRTDLLQAVLEYQKRDRRYGGLSGVPVNGASLTKPLPAGDDYLEALRRHEACSDRGCADPHCLLCGAVGGPLRVPGGAGRGGLPELARIP